MKSLSEFLAARQNSSYIFYPNMEVYVRKGTHLIAGELVDTFDIARVAVDEDRQRRGLFTTFLVEAEATGYPIYVENIFNRHLLNFLRRRGYSIIEPDEVMPGLRGPACALSQSMTIPPWGTKRLQMAKDGL